MKYKINQKFLSQNKKIIRLILLIFFVIAVLTLTFFVFKPAPVPEIEQPEVVESIIEKTPEQLIMEQQTQELEALMEELIPLADEEIIQQTRELEELFQQIR